MRSRRPALGIAAAALALALASSPGAAEESVDELRRHVEGQDELIRRQTEALARQTEQIQQLADRLRTVEDERLAEKSSGPPDVAAGPTPPAPQPHRPGAGFPITSGDYGSLTFRLYTSVRYLNQKALDEDFTDSFGQTSDIDRRQDIQFQKVLLYFGGWALDPKFHYLLYVWTANTSQGLSAQVVVAGKLEYAFNEHVTLGGGTEGLPGVRSTTGNFPAWFGVDDRLIADEFVRPSYTFGVWAKGDLLEGLSYKVMLGNNLSQLGVDAGQLDDGLDTLSTELAWAPLGEFGDGFGDYEMHSSLVSRVALHFTRSTETSQGQPGTNAFDNVQIRLSDGNVIFEPDLFGPGIQLRRANYQMVDVDAGVKYKGFALEGEYYFRWIDELHGPGTAGLPFDEIRDHAFQLQASAMLLPEALQAYVSGSMVFGDYGDPWDARLGVNWFPFRNKTFRWNNELIYVHDSPVGALSLPYQVGARGPIFLSTLELFY